MLAHTILTNHRPYLVYIHVRSLVSNIQNLVYSSALPNVACREPIIPPVFVSFIGNVMEQNLVRFPNSMYTHVGPYTPYFGSGYGGIKGVPTMWPPMLDPLANPMASPKPISGIV